MKNEKDFGIPKKRKGFRDEILKRSPFIKFLLENCELKPVPPDMAKKYGLDEEVIPTTERRLICETILANMIFN